MHVPTMMQLFGAQIVISVLPLLLLILKVEGAPAPSRLQQDAAVASSSSPWLRRVTNHRRSGCWNRPSVCYKGSAPGVQRSCCRNRCVDLASDVNNCGLCGIKCPFNWQCCRGLCINTHVSQFNCGGCGNVCPRGLLCSYGMCGYAQPFPPLSVTPRLPKPQLPQGFEPPPTD